MSIHEETTVVGRTADDGRCSTISSCSTSTSRRTASSSIVPDLATDWAWNGDGTRLTFHLRQGVKWHDGKPFTAADVKCTWDLLQGKATEKLRVNPRKSWYNNLAEVITDGDYEVTFVLKRPQPAFLALLASGMSPVYPCHVSPARDAPAPDRHRAVQIRRVQAERIHQGRPQSRLLEAGPALPRRHRVHALAQPFDRDPGLCRREIRADLRRHADHPADARSAEPAARRDLRAAAGQRQHQSDRQPDRAALRQSRSCAGRWR